MRTTEWPKKPSTSLRNICMTNIARWWYKAIFLTGRLFIKSKTGRMGSNWVWEHWYNWIYSQQFGLSFDTSTLLKDQRFQESVYVASTSTLFKLFWKGFVTFGYGVCNNSAVNSISKNNCIYTAAITAAFM